MRGKPLVLKRLENGCIIPTSHKLNADGYFRYRLPNKDNHLRYKKRKEKAKEYWSKTHCSGASLASLVGVSFSSACRWIREWKA